MIYQIKKPLMIVGFILSFVLSLSVLAVDEPVPATQNTQPQTAPAPTNQAATSPTDIDGLSLPENAQSTIIPTSKATDIRVIIDISGSMKQNDPDNLRIPALNLIVEMIPEGARAGVWTFGQWVNMLIPPAIVNKQWRDTAKQSTKEINSYGLRTNIGQAMEQATWQFERDGQYEQHAILLTDGLVDIAADNDPQQQVKNSAERQRIITEILKQYKDLGVKIHSIGLSNNADKVLLDKLALETDGSSVIVNSPEELVKAFLKAFEKAAPEVAEQVPLSNDNTFDIDASVEEFTALVFRKKGTPALQLTAPSGAVVSQIKSIENARWFGESVYDLVTITKPEAGKWKIEAELDPDNRVTVVSDLKMEIKNLPNSLFPGQQIDFEVYLHEDGKVINNPDFLKLMTFEMTMTAESGRSGTKVISDPENLPADGRYKESISRLSKEGQYELKIEVDGKTFKRMRKDYIQVRQPIGFEIRKTESGKNQSYAVRVIPQVTDVEVAKTRVIAKLKGPDQSSIIQAMPWVEEGVWEAVIAPDKGPGVYEITMNIKGSLGENQEFRVKPDSIKLTFPIPADFTHEYLTQSEETVETEGVTDQKTEEKPTEEVAPVVEGEPAAEDASSETPETAMPNLEDKMKAQEEEAVKEEPAETLAQEAVPPEPEEVLEPIPYWLYAAIPIGVLLLGVGGFFVYRKIMKKKLASTENDAPKESEDKQDVTLNDGLDDEDFDEDFDLSGDDGDEMAINMDNDEPEDVVASDGIDDIDDTEMDEPEPDVAAQPVEDDIPDFDENFDVDNNPQADESPVDETASAIDELDNVLDGLTDEDEENIPQLDETIGEEPSEPDAEDLAGEDSMAEFDLSNESDAQTEPAMEEEDDNSIDAALANLESELDDIDVDALIDEDKKE